MKKIKECILDWLPLAIALMLLSFMFLSCKGSDKVVYVPIHDTIKNNVAIYTHDTTIVEKTREVVVHGDCTDTHDTIREVRIKVVHDTMVNYQYVERPIEVTKTKIEKVYLWWPAILVLVVCGILGCYFHHKKKK